MQVRKEEMAAKHQGNLKDGSGPHMVDDQRRILDHQESMIRHMERAVGPVSQNRRRNMEILYRKRLEQEHMQVQREIFLERHKRLAESMNSRNKMLP